MKALVCCITDGTCSYGLARSLLDLSTAHRFAAAGLDLTYEKAASLPDAIAMAREHEFDALVAIHSTIAFNPGFVLRALLAKCPFVVGVYPLPHIDWERVVAKAGSTSEDDRFKANRYSVDPADAPVPAKGYVAVGSAGLDAVVLKAEALEALDGVRGDLCEAWGREVWADLDAPCSKLGRVHYDGCIGLRANGDN